MMRQRSLRRQSTMRNGNTPVFSIRSYTPTPRPRRLPSANRLVAETIAAPDDRIAGLRAVLPEPVDRRHEADAPAVAQPEGERHRHPVALHDVPRRHAAERNRVREGVVGVVVVEGHADAAAAAEVSRHPGAQERAPGAEVAALVEIALALVGAGDRDERPPRGVPAPATAPAAGQQRDEREVAAIRLVSNFIASPSVRNGYPAAAAAGCGGRRAGAPLAAEHRHVERRQEHQHQQRPDQQAAHDREGHRPPEHRRRDRDEAEHGRERRERQRPQPRARRADHRIPDVLAFRAVGLDLHHQDHRVLRDHPEQRQDAEDGDEAERPIEQRAAPAPRR